MTTVYEKMKEKKAACDDPEADTLICDFPWPVNLTYSYAEILLLGCATEYGDFRESQCWNLWKIC